MHLALERQDFRIGVYVLECRCGDIRCAGHIAYSVYKAVVALETACLHATELEQHHQYSYVSRT